MVIEAAPQTSCPTCGVKITQTHLSLCAYCGSPLGIQSGDRPPVDRTTLRRLTKMREHDDFAQAQSWDPPETLDVQDALARRARSTAAIATGSLLVLLGLWPLLATGGGSAIGWIGFGIGAVAAGWGTLGRIAVARAVAEARQAPLMRRCAIVADRRSQTDVATGRTTYYFMLQFEDGSEAEFRYPGRGAAHDPLVAGNTGVAYTRRQELLAFRPIRV